MNNQIKGRNIESILNLAQIKFNVKQSYKWGSEYWTIKGESYRVSDHDKPSGETWSFDGDFRNHNDLLNFLKNRNDINLENKTKLEKKYKKDAKNKIKTEHNDNFGTVYITPDNRMFNNVDNALNYMWRNNTSNN